jgi:hypothetical protein
MDDNKIISSGNYMPHAEYIELYAKKIDYEDKIKNKSGIYLIREDTLLMSSGTGLAASCFIYGFVFLVLSVITGLFIDLIRKIIRMEKKKSQAG